MPTQYTTMTSSGKTTKAEDIPLAASEDEANALTRRVVRGEFVINKRDANQPVKIMIMHQKRHTSKEPWKDAESFNLATLKAGQEVRLGLTCDETYRLLDALKHLDAIGQKGLPPAGAKFEVVDPDQTTIVKGKNHEILKSILETEGEDVFPILDSLRPGLLKVAALKQQHTTRMKSVNGFRKYITDPTVKEGKWQNFFEDNDWIFGHGLEYRFLHRLQTQPNYGGVEVDGTGAPRGDFLYATKARVGFTVIVEIKTPFSSLLGNHQYRNKAFEIGPELVNAVAQVQAQCGQWGEDGSRERANMERSAKADIYTYEPKGILVIGTTDQFADDPDKRSTFERFRRNLHNPEILTFDELLKRAEFMVSEPTT